jgi:hypothetical protein
MNIIPWSKATNDALVVFHHLPKCAGTAFSSALSDYFGAENYSWFHGPAGALEEMRNGTTLRSVAGHFHLSHIYAKDITTPTIMVTLFRNPIDRVISQYYYLRRNSEHHLHGMAMQHSLEEVFTKGLARRLQMSNQITGMVTSLQHGSSESKMLNSAKNNVTKYTFFGFQEDLRTFSLLVEARLGISNFIIPDLTNHSRNRPGLHEVETNIIEVIKEHNQLDLDLYKFAWDTYNEKLKTEWK